MSKKSYTFCIFIFKSQNRNSSIIFFDMRHCNVHFQVKYDCAAMSNNIHVRNYLIDAMYLVWMLRGEEDNTWRMLNYMAFHQIIIKRLISHIVKSVMRCLLFTTLLSNLSMVIFSLIVLIAPRDNPRIAYKGWLTSAGLACGNIVICIQSATLLLRGSICLPCMFVIWFVVFICSLVWGVIHIQVSNGGENIFHTLIATQVANVCFTCICTVYTLVRATSRRWGSTNDVDLRLETASV